MVHIYEIKTTNRQTLCSSPIAKIKEHVQVMCVCARVCVLCSQGARRSLLERRQHWMVRRRSLAGPNSGWSFRVDSYQFMAFSNSSYEDIIQTFIKHSNHLTSIKYSLMIRQKNKSKIKITDHSYIDVCKSKMINDKVRSNFHCHARHSQGVLPQSRILEDVGKADERHILTEQK